MEGLALLDKVAESAHIKERVQRMFAGEIINETEKRQVGHVKLRDPSVGEVTEV